MIFKPGLLRVDNEILRWMGIWLNFESRSLMRHSDLLVQGEGVVFYMRPISQTEPGCVGIRSIASNVHQFSSPSFVLTNKRLILLDGEAVVDIIHLSFLESDAGDHSLKVVGPPEEGSASLPTYRFVLAKKDGLLTRIARMVEGRPSWLHRNVDGFIKLIQQAFAD